MELTGGIMDEETRQRINVLAMIVFVMTMCAERHISTDQISDLLQQQFLGSQS